MAITVGPHQLPFSASLPNQLEAITCGLIQKLRKDRSVPILLLCKIWQLLPIFALSYIHPICMVCSHGDTQHPAPVDICRMCPYPLMVHHPIHSPFLTGMIS